MRLSEAKQRGLGKLKKKILQLPDYPFVAIGVDPGGTTGVSVFVVHEDATMPFAFYQWGNPDTVYAELEALAVEYEEEYGLPIVFVIEQFDKRPGVADPDFTPKFIINDIERNLSHRTIVWQIVSAAKNLVKPATKGREDGLKRFGWYQVGMGHANDATRHVIMFLVETMKHMPTIKRGWPKP